LPGHRPRSQFLTIWVFQQQQGERNRFIQPGFDFTQLPGVDRRQRFTGFFSSVSATLHVSQRPLRPIGEVLAGNGHQQGGFAEILAEIHGDKTPFLGDVELPPDGAALGAEHVKKATGAFFTRTEHLPADRTAAGEVPGQRLTDYVTRLPQDQATAADGASLSAVGDGRVVDSSSA